MTFGPTPEPGALAARTLLLVSGGFEAVAAVHEAHRMGVRVLAAAEVPDAPAFRLADAALLARTSDPEATVEAARAYAARHGIDGVLAVGTDAPRTVAAVADALGLPGISLATAELAADRLALHACLRAAGVATAWSAPVASAAELGVYAARDTRALVVRPVDGRGTRGVVRLLPAVDAAWAFAVAQAASPTGRVMVEAWPLGPHVRAESVAVGGRVMTIALADVSHECLGPPAPFVVVGGAEMPSALPVGTCAAVERAVAMAAAALGVHDAAITAEVAVERDVPLVLGVRARLSGGFSCSHEVPLATGVNLMAAAIGLALGRPPAVADLVPRWARAVAQRCVFAPAGRVVAVEGSAEVASGEGIALVEVRVRPGDVVPPPVERIVRAGRVIAIGDTRGEAMARVRRGVARLRVLTQPDAG
ncbi:MAG: phosphoribosylglycinamide synthetase [Candidatus Binatia bacterium]